MADNGPFVRKSGSGPAIVCLHSSTSSSKQWQALMDLLASEYQVIAPDLYGYGKSPAWSQQRAFTLGDELALIKPVLDSIPGPFHLIGHSYGAAVAFKLALTCPSRIRSLVTYEPVLFNLLLENDDSHHATLETRSVQDDVRRNVEEGELAKAARRFVDYWSGEGSWDKLPDWQKNVISERMPKVVSDFDATLGNPTPLSEYRELDIPTLFLYGVDSPASTRRIAEWLGQTLPKAEVRGLIGRGHMGPLTHADQIFEVIRRFIQMQPKGILVHQLRRTLPQS